MITISPAQSARSTWEVPAPGSQGQKMMRVFFIAFCALALAGCSKPRDGAHEVRLARQYGLSYLPLVVMERERLVEKRAREAGLGDITVTWVTVSSGAAATDALLSGSVDYIATGVTPLITLWNKTDREVRGVAALDSAPLILNTTDPNIRTIADFSSKHRIAVPAARVSIQAVILEMAAARAFGLSNYARLDPLTVSMKHPDALLALLSGNSEVTAHLASPPFTFAERSDPRVHAALNSFDLLGPHTVNVLSTTRAFHDGNPDLYAAVLAALEDAMTFISTNKSASAELYVKAYQPRETAAELTAELNDRSLTFSTTPLNVTKFSDFLHDIGAISSRPPWRDFFFSNIHQKPGS